MDTKGSRKEILSNSNPVHGKPRIALPSKWGRLAVSSLQFCGGSVGPGRTIRAHGPFRTVVTAFLAFTESKMPVRQIKAIQFGLLSPAETVSRRRKEPASVDGLAKSDFFGPFLVV